MVVNPASSLALQTHLNPPTPVVETNVEQREDVPSKNRDCHDILAHRHPQLEVFDLPYGNFRITRIHYGQVARRRPRFEFASSAIDRLLRPGWLNPNSRREPPWKKRAG